MSDTKNEKAIKVVNQFTYSRGASASVAIGVFWYVWGVYGFWWGLLYGFFWPVWLGFRLAAYLLA